MLLEEKIIVSAENLAKRIQEVIEVDIAVQYIRAVKSRLRGIRYRKIIKASYHVNSTQNLILLKKWALKYAELREAGYSFLNVDETRLGMSDFRRMKWREHGTSNAVATVLMCPRISMITGVDTLGNSYVTLT